MDFSHYLINCRQTGDQPGDAAIAALLKSNPEFWRDPGWRHFSRNSDRPDGGWPVELRHLVAITEQLPAWADFGALQRSQRFFSRHRSLIFLCLGLYSLPYCYAAADGARVLYHSRRLRESPGKRLAETASFVMDVCEPGAFEESGKALRSILKVRLMHAMARYQLLRQSFWRTEEWGKPVNQEDMAGTNLAFSLIVLRGLRKFGIDISAQEAYDVLHCWRVIGFLLGVDQQLLPASVTVALKLEREIRRRQFRSSDEGMALAASLAGYIRQQMATQKISLPVHGLMQRLLGKELSLLVGIGASGPEQQAADAFLFLSRLQTLLGSDFLWRNDPVERVTL